MLATSKLAADPAHLVADHQHQEQCHRECHSHSQTFDHLGIGLLVPCHMEQRRTEAEEDKGEKEKDDISHDELPVHEAPILRCPV